MIGESDIAIWYWRQILRRARQKHNQIDAENRAGYVIQRCAQCGMDVRRDGTRFASDCSICGNDGVTND